MPRGCTISTLILEQMGDGSPVSTAGSDYHEKGMHRFPRQAGVQPLGHPVDEQVGDREFAEVSPGTKDTASCTAFFEDLKRRGLADPLLVVTDGAPGLIRAVETCFPRALRQRCLVHRLRNLRSKAPESRWPEIALRA